MGKIKINGKNILKMMWVEKYRPEKFSEIKGQEEAVTKIQNLIKWGDLTGALELSLKTNQMETYNKLIEKIEL